MKFRAKNYIEPVNELNDLNPKSEDVIGVNNQIEELEKKGFDMLNRVPQNDATCSIQIKYYITAAINSAKEQCDYCVERHLVENENRLEMNVRILVNFILIMFLIIFFLYYHPKKSR